MAEDVRLLIPLDGSKLAEHALAYVPMLIPLGVTRVELVSVVAPEIEPARRRGDAEQRERNLLASYQAGVAEDIRRQTALAVDTKVLSGPPAAAILQEAEAFRPDFLVISTHGASGISRWRLGSVADKVVRGVTCPTLVVGPGATDRDTELETRLLPAFKSILVPLDGSQLAEQALTLAASFGEAHGAEAHLVSVVSPGAMAVDASWAGVSDQLAEDLGHEARDYLEKAASTVTWKCPLHLAVRFGSPAESLQAYIRENAIDLVILSSHGRGGLVRTALGSTTDRLLGAAGAPLLIARGR